MQVSEKNALKTVVEEKMRKMFFSQPVINRYFDSVSQKELISMNTLLDDEQEVRRVSRRARYIKTANFPTMKSFDDYDFSGIKFPKNFSKEDMLSLIITTNLPFNEWGPCLLMSSLLLQLSTVLFITDIWLIPV